MKKSYLIIAIQSDSEFNCEVIFVKDDSSIELSSLSFMRSCALVFDDFNEACRIAHIFETSAILPASFHVVLNSNLW